MSHVIRLSESLYNRLKKYAEPFETPVQAIERALNKLEGIEKEPKKINLTKEGILNIELEPNNPDIFKQKLLEKHYANITEYYNDNREPVKRVWKARRFSENSNVIGNLRSRPKYRQGAWQEKGISHLKVEVVD